MSDQPTLLSDQPRRPANLLPFGAGAILFIVLLSAGSLIGGELGSFMGASINAAPFAVLAILAYMGGARPNWAWLATGLWLALLVGAVGLMTLSYGLIAIFGGPLNDPANPPQLTNEDLLRIALIVLGILGSVLAGALLLIPPLRRALARVLPLDPSSFVHTTALVAVVSVGMICAVPLLVLGAPPALAAVDLLTEAMAGRGEGGQLRDQLYGLVWTVPAAILAVGFGITRGLREALLRLGLVRPTLRQAVAGVVIALLLAGAVQLIGGGIDWLWRSLGWPVTDQDAFAELLAFAINPLGAVVIGVVAGLGEELAVRGVLQPRLGLILSNLFFTSLHALQYNWDALLIVFVVGVVCGLVRQRTNTTTAAIVHGTYNFTLIMLAAAGIGA
ncbi:MAG TPA: CPBP family intramembrane metalloprotease [Chloroflexaceae bacterium]|nr:CPBP family intramembrane metalloprotease [Chloroflexaceae bacterium]